MEFELVRREGVWDAKQLQHDDYWFIKEVPETDEALGEGVMPQIEVEDIQEPIVSSQQQMVWYWFVDFLT